MSEQKETPNTEKPTGRYAYDKKLGKVVKVSDDVPGLKKGGGGGQDGGGCPMKPGGHTCNGCCGH